MCVCMCVYPVILLAPGLTLLPSFSFPASFRNRPSPEYGDAAERWFCRTIRGTPTCFLFFARPPLMSCRGFCSIFAQASHFSSGSKPELCRKQKKASATQFGGGWLYEGRAGDRLSQQRKTMSPLLRWKDNGGPRAIRV
jgi:hypothetical protein